MTVHFINNAVSVSMEYLGFSLADNKVGTFYTLIVLSLAAVGSIAGLILIFGYRKHLRMQPKTTTLTVGERYGTLFKAPTFLIAIILYIVLTGLGM